jgi:hypothetical protein
MVCTLLNDWHNTLLYFVTWYFHSCTNNMPHIVLYYTALYWCYDLIHILALKRIYDMQVNSTLFYSSNMNSELLQWFHSNISVRKAYRRNTHMLPTLYYLIYSLWKSNPLKLSECSILAWTAPINLLFYALHSTILSILLAHSIYRIEKNKKLKKGCKNYDEYCPVSWDLVVLQKLKISEAHTQHMSNFFKWR